MKYYASFRLRLIIAAFICAAVIPIYCQTKLQTRVIAANLNVPWEIIWGEDGNIWFTERDGSISYINPTNGQIREIAKFDDTHQQSESGMLGMAIDRDNGITHIYVVYNYRVSGQIMEKVVSFDYNGSGITDPKVLLQGIKGGSIHNGSRIWLAPDKTLYVTTGETGDGPLAQNRNSLNGKILRLKTDGTIPSDNPTPGSYIWTLGHRNGQGLVFAKGKLYESEHGPSNDDEINIIEKGRNYGWPNVEGYCNTSEEKAFCAANNVVEPIYTWTPTIAPSGLEYYDSDLIPEWRNCLLLATLKGSRIVALKLNDEGTAIENATEYFVGEFGRLRDLCIAPDGRVYVSTSNYDNNSNSNKIIEIKPENMNAPEPVKTPPPKKENTGSGFRVFPNPAVDYICVDNYMENISQEKIEIFDSIGGRIAPTFFSSNTIDLSGFAPGVYFISNGRAALPFAVIR